MQHLDEGTIHSWLDGALSADEAARVEAHVKECPQCAAAVAEARGFIAASSRILTALDNAPRGVIPATAPKKRVDPIVWRVAATFLVVAAGTLVVFRNGGREAQIATTNANTGQNTVTAVAPTVPAGDETTMTAEPTPPLRKPANSTRGTTVGGLQPSAGLSEKSAAKVGAAGASTPTSQALSPSAPRVTYQAGTRVPAPQPNRSASENQKIAGQASGAVTDNVSTSSGYARAAPAPQAVAAIRLRGASTRDARSEQLQVIRTSSTLGANVTLYEVAPGDTVTFSEHVNAQLESAVTTSLSSDAARAPQLTGKVAAAPTKRAAPAVASAPDSQRPTAVAGALAAAPSRPAPATQVEVSNGVTTISWVDATTGSMLKLSGRMPEARLQQIKIKIERERAAAPAKKQP
jgi:anti-sigma factor RsiW